MHKAKKVFLCACSIYSQFIDKQLETYKAYQAIEYLWNLLEYNSSWDPLLEFKMEEIVLGSWDKASRWKYLQWKLHSR